MRDHDVPAKTQEGLTEIKTRAMGLAPRMRTALLLVDGSKPVGELEQLLAASGVKPGALQTLLEKGLISIAQDESLNAPVTETRGAAAEAAEATEVAAVPQAGPITQAGPISHPVPAPEATPPAPIPAPKAMPMPEAATAPETVPAARAAVAPEPAQAPEAPPAPKPKLPPTKAASGAASPAKTSAAPKTKLASTPKPAPAAKASSTSKAAPAPPRPVRSASPQSAPAPARASEPSYSHEEVEVREPQAQIFVPPPPPEDMKLLVARAHVANALDDRVDSYVLKQMVASCSSRAQLESLFDAAEQMLNQSVGSARSEAVLGVAKALLQS